MKENLTYLIFVVDRSGSMSSICKDMIGGFNSFIKAQRDAKIGDAKVFFYQFDTEYETVHEGISLEDVPDLTDKTYVPRGSTALYGSLGKTITDMGIRLENMPENERPEKVFVITITDGEDNAYLTNESNINEPSQYRVYTSEKVKEMIKHQTEVYKWDFAYIGANQDAWSVGSGMGHGAGTTMGYVASAAGTAYMFNKLSDDTSNYRSAKGAKFAFSPDPNPSTPKTP